MKTIAFGDIHGCFPAAERAVQLAEELQVQAIFLGDYVDRGPSAVKTLRALIHAREEHSDWIFLRGNHDQMLLDLIHEVARPSDIGEVLGMNFDYGQAARSYQEWQQTDAGERKAIISFLEETSFYHTTNRFIYCHAVLRDTRAPIHQKPRQELMWNYEHQPIWEEKAFVHGHLPSQHVSFCSKGININTSCGYGGILTGLYCGTNDDELVLYSISEGGALLAMNRLIYDI